VELDIIGLAAAVVDIIHLVKLEVMVVSAAAVAAELIMDLLRVLVELVDLMMV
jgi:hypothetical protein